MKIALWSINKWLRYTGFRLVVTRIVSEDSERNGIPTHIGVVFWGWKFLFKTS